MSGHGAPVPRLRPMTAEDADAVAALHTLSWQTAYRGIFSDAWLDREAAANRRAHWARRFAAPRADEAGLVAEDGGRLVGFVYLIRDGDPARGTLVDNLHVAPGSRGQGVGTVLLGAAARLAADRGWPEGLHLWVYAANTGARRFYERHGGVMVDQVSHESAEGRPHPAVCYHWPAGAVP